MSKRKCMECKEKYEDERLDMPYCESCSKKLTEENESQIREQENQTIMDQVRYHPWNCDCFICIHY